MKRSIDMVNGPILGKILLFTIPLMASNILQLLFNAVDIVVVGRFAGYNSLAAVGSTSSIVNLFTNLLIGISVGVNVIVARYIGQGYHEKEISKVIHTSVFLAFTGGAALGLLGIVATPGLLRLMDTPAETFHLTLLYLRIYFIGTPMVMLYNYGAAALRAQGDTQRPLVYLTASGILNLGLNLLFVIVFRMDVAGVALATVISQSLSALLVLRYLCRTDGPLHFSWREMRLDGRSLKSIAHVGIPAGIQGCLFSLSNVVIQGAINSYGNIIMAGSSASYNIENFIYISMNAFHNACQTFVSQNVGAGKYERIGPIVRRCLACQTTLGLVMCTFALTFSRQLVGIYNSDPAVIAAGCQRIGIMATFYVFFGMADVLTGAIRGYGVPIAPVIINLLGTCVLRVIWISLLDTTVYDVTRVYATYPITWMIVLVSLAACWFLLRHREKRRVAL